MELCIIYEDNTVWVKMGTEEFTELLSKKLKKDVKPAMAEIVKEIKKRTNNK